MTEGQWYDFTVRAVGDHLVHTIDGQTVVDITDAESAHRATSGVLALQIHSGEPMTVQYKDIRLRVISKAE